MSSILNQLSRTKFSSLYTTLELKDEKIPKKEENKAIQKGISGVASGLFTTALLHPFEVIKIRMQSDATHVHTQSWRELLHQARNVGIYNGASANILAAGLAWGIYFGLFDTFKPFTHKNITTKTSQAFADFNCSLLSSVISQVITNPLWVLKTRMSLQNVALPGQSTIVSAVGRSTQYNHVFHGMYRLYKEEGIRGYYKGFSATILGMVHGAVVMTLYQQIKPSLQKVNDNLVQNDNYEGKEKESWFSVITSASVAGFVSKVFATILTYPTQVVRTRMQDHRYYHASHGQEQRMGMWQILTDIWKTNGVKGLYRGMTVQVFRASIANMLIFTMFESVQTYISRKCSSDKSI